MPGRLAIPAEIARAVLVESGHRCAVCGDIGGLQVVHVVASHRSGEDNAEDLICLCANCHQRADTEKWGQKILKEYKLHPWVVRQTRNGPVAEDWRALGSRPGPGVRPEAPEPKDGRENLLGRVTANPAIFAGKPIIRGMRISVEMILSLLAQGETRETLLADYPELEPEDIRACLAYAHAVIAHDSLEGAEIIVAVQDDAEAPLVPAPPGAQPRTAGLHPGAAWTSDDFDAPLPEDFWTGAS